MRSIHTSGLQYMPMDSKTIDVNQTVLKWARAESGLSISEVAKKINRETTKVDTWEKDGKDLTLYELKCLAREYKRQVAVFFLPEAPELAKTPKDRRSLSVYSKKLDSETMLAIRRTSRYLNIVRELESNTQIQSQYTWLDEFAKEPPDNICNFFRSLLAISVTDQKAFRDSAETLRTWRRQVETRLGIYTFRFPMPEGGIDGFSYVEEGRPYAIVLNSRTAKNRQVFTLFHELAHIIEGSSGLCIVSGGGFNLNNPEVRCNKFAAEFLMPKSAMEQPASFKELKELAGKLNVSAEAYLIRLLDLKFLDSVGFSDYLDELKTRTTKVKKRRKKKEIPISPIIMSKSRRGEKFFNFVVDAYESGGMSASEAADILKVRPTRIDRP